MLKNVTVEKLDGLDFCQFCGREATKVVRGIGAESGVHITQHVCDRHVPGGDFSDWDKAQEMRRKLTYITTGRYTN